MPDPAAHGRPAVTVRVEDGFWGALVERNHTVTVPHALTACEERQRGTTHFEIAAGIREGEHTGEAHHDSDLFKTLEGAFLCLQQREDPALAARVEEWVNRIAAVQQPDGYLNSYFIAHPEEERYGDIFRSHELYAFGHLLEAAVAHAEWSGTDRLLDVARRLADHVDATFGPGKRETVPGHQELELALVKLWQATGEARYLDLAQYFVDMRGEPERVRREYAGKPIIESDRTPGRNRPPEYRQDHQPATEQRRPIGHAVRAGYFYAAMADIARVRNSAAHAAAVHAIWEEIVRAHLFLTGGVGTHQHRDEGFGDDYRLPNDTGYCETCGGIALLLFTERMSRLRRDSRYADVIELILHNLLLGCPDLDGTHFHYRNPLSSEGDRARHPWPNPACCPTNVVRMIPQVGRFAYAVEDDTLSIDQFVSSTVTTVLAGTSVTISQTSQLPWHGEVALSVDPEAPAAFALAIRIPGWCEGRPVPSDLYTVDASEETTPTLTVNGATVDLQQRTRGYAVIRRTWTAGDTVTMTLPLPVQRVHAHPQVEADRGRVALMRGPLVYCLEAADHDEDLDAITLAPDATFVTEQDPNHLGGVTLLRQIEGPVSAIPYYTWNNREKGKMRVWIAEAYPTPS